MAEPIPTPSRPGSPAPAPLGAPAVLYFDPNPTTAKLAAAGLQLAGYEVLVAANAERAVELCRVRGPCGDGSVVALLLDTATAPAVSEAVLRALLDVPGAPSLPGILLVSAGNPIPFAGAERLPTLRRPFTTPALVKALREATHRRPARALPRGRVTMNESILAVELALLQCFPDLDINLENVRHFANLLNQLAELPTPATAISLRAELAGTRLESVLEILDREGARGMLVIEHEEEWARIHLDGGRVRLAETNITAEDFRIGRFVAELGGLAADETEAILSAHDPLRRHDALRLLEDGRVRPDELTVALSNQAREIVCHVLTWTTGRASFAPGDEPHPVAAALGRPASELRITEALLLGLRNADVRAQMGPHLPGLDDIFVRVDSEVAKLGRHAFTRDELGVLEHLNGRHNLKEVARRTQTGTFAVAKILVRLERSGLARRRPPTVQTRD